MKSFCIIGGGACGLLAAVQILEQSSDSRVAVFDPAAELGLGIAYGTESLGHLLNVPASGMSARADAPDHFLDWLVRQDGWRPAGGIGPRSFAPRRIYRDYLQSLLRPWQDGGGGRFVHHRLAVTDLKTGRDGVEVLTAGGQGFRADAAILAAGLGAGPLWHGDPGLAYWSSPSGFGLPQDAPVAILGTGLSMIDSVVSLLDGGHAGPITAISRRGLVSRPHAEAALAKAGESEAGEPEPPQDRSLAGLAAWFRRQRRDGRHDWRQLVDSLRPGTQAIWAGFSAAEKRRFLRHARPWWDVHRHRMAPAVHARIEAARASGQLRILAASLAGDPEAGQGAMGRGDLTIRRRGTAACETVAARHVIDCRGLAGSGAMAENPLLARLVASGLACRAVAGLGIEVAADCAVIDRAGRPSPRLFAIGPLTLGTFWEILAIPDIRLQLRDLAPRLMAVPACSGAAAQPPVPASATKSGSSR